MATRKRIFASEREMESRWEACAGACLQTMKGEMVRIVYPGIRAGSAGPDYKDAVVVFDGGELARGDVELHLRVTDWRRHGHDSDHAYDRVVLHVVGDAGRAVVTRLASGEEVATAALSGRPLGREKTALPCQARAVDLGAVLLEVLTQAGVARLLSRACSIAADVAAPEPCAALVHRTARALGYSANAAAAERLGRMLTARAVVELLAQSDARGRNALLLGMAGLLPSQRRRAGMAVAAEAREMEAVWRAAGSATPSLEPGVWRMHGLYPNNSPVRRVVALAGLWPRLAQLPSRIPSLIDAACEQPKRAAGLLEAPFRLAGDRDWRCLRDFGLPAREADLVGGSKARELVVNALLPCAAATALREGDLSRLTMVARVLSAYPPADANSVTAHMQRQLGIGRHRSSAAIQQGLLHIFSEYCRLGRCDACPLGGAADLRDNDYREGSIRLRAT